jgi:hypothetical protein
MLLFSSVTSLFIRKGLVVARENGLDGWLERRPVVLKRFGFGSWPRSRSKRLELGERRARGAPPRGA